MKEKISVQRELAHRAGDTLPFMDEILVRGVVKAIQDEMVRIRQRSGSVVYSEPLTFREEQRVLRILARHHGGLVKRIEAFCPIKLEEGIGTEILIREKGRR